MEYTFFSCDIPELVVPSGNFLTECCYKEGSYWTNGS